MCLGEPELWVGIQVVWLDPNAGTRNATIQSIPILASIRQPPRVGIVEAAPGLADAEWFVEIQVEGERDTRSVPLSQLEAA